MVNSGLCCVEIPSLRKLRLISYTRSRPPTTNRFKYSSGAMRKYKSISRVLWWVTNGFAAAPPASGCIIGVSTSMYPPASKKSAGRPGSRSNPDSAAGSAARHRSNHAIFPARAKAPSTGASFPQPIMTARPFSSGKDGRARRSHRQDPAGETIRIPARRPRPCEHKSAVARRFPARVQTRPFPSDGKTPGAPQWPLRSCWPPAPPRLPRNTLPPTPRALLSSEIHADTGHGRLRLFFPACVVAVRTDPWARIAMPATSILSKINGEYNGPHEVAATKHYYLDNILIYSLAPGENFDEPRPVPQVRFCPARLARHSAIRQRLAVLRSHRQARKRLRNAKRFTQRSDLLAA